MNGINVTGGEFATVVEDEIVVVEGEVQDVEEVDGGLAVEMKESEQSVVTFWSDGVSTSLSRETDGIERPIQVSDEATVMASSP